METQGRDTFMTNYVRLCYVAGHENRMLLEELLEYLISTCTNFDNYHIYRFFKDGDAALILECIELNSFDKLHLHLLYYLIRELNLIQPPSRGWGATSHHGSLTIGDGVQLIYQKYNLIFHSGQTQFTDEEVREIFSIFKDIARIFERFFYHRCDEEIVSRYTIIETCCVDHEMRSKYREHLHLLEMNLKNTSGPKYFRHMYIKDQFQLSSEITNYMRVIYTIQVVLTEDVRKCIASCLPPEYFRQKIIEYPFYDRLPSYIKYTIAQCRHEGYKNFSLYWIKKLIVKTFFSFEFFNIDEILRERDEILCRGNTHLTDEEMRKTFSTLKKIAKDLEKEMKAHSGNIVAKVDYYETCCMDERTFKWFKEGLIYLAAEEQQFGTYINFGKFKDLAVTSRYWYLPSMTGTQFLNTKSCDHGSHYVLVGYAFEETLSVILQELLSHYIPHGLLFAKMFLSDRSTICFNAREYLQFLESQKNGYSDFDTILLSSVMIQLPKTPDVKVFEKIQEKKYQLLNKYNMELTDHEMMDYFSFFKDVARFVESILLNSRHRFVTLFEKLENLLSEGEQLQLLIASLLAKKQKPAWMEKGRFGKTPAVLDSKEFYELLEHGYYDCYENRLYLGGPCNAGKTSLACILTGDDVPDKWMSTNGLQIYFGQNGIHLKDKKMIPIRKGMFCHTVHGKVISAIKNIQEEDVAPNTKVNTIEKKEIADFQVGRLFTEVDMDNDFLDDKWKQWKQTLENDLKTHKSPYLKDEMYRFKHSSRNDLNKNIGNKETTIAFIQKMSFNDNEIEELEMSATISVEKTTTTEEIRKDKKINPHHVVSKEHTPLSPVPSKTLNVLQEEELRKSIFDEIRRGEYNVEIAPSDLVDFGGQKAFDMTHQLFIMQEGTVLLLFDGSKDLDEPLPEYPGKNITSADILMHWVNSVTTYCTDDSGLQRIQFVATHSDKYKGNFEKRRKELVMQLTTRLKKHEIGSHLLFDNLIFIDARNKDDKEIDRLKDQLVQLAFSQSSWGKKMPLIWVPLEKQIVDLKLRGTSILRMEEIEKLNRLNEDLMMDDEKLKFFLRTQHAIGKLIFFDQDELADFVIIEPSVLVNALRSFVTDEMFFPSENYHILKILQQDGMLKTTDLMKLWNQDEFQYIFQNQEYKDFLVKILLHLDVLVKPKIDYRDVNFLPEYYIVPCMIQTRLDNDYIEKYLNTNKSICMAYVLKVQMVPPCILFRLIASAVGIWPLKVYQGRKMIFQDIATFVFDETNEFSIIMQGGKIVIYFTNLNSIKEIQSPKVASVQECLTIAIISITEFYQLHSRSIDDLDNTRFDNLFELKHGAACKIPCFVNREEELQFPKAGLWKCQHGQIHEVDYLWYWDSKKNQENAQSSFIMADISPTVLTKKPPADLLRKVSFAVGIDGAKLGLNLGIESSVIEKMVIGNRYNIFEKTQKILDYWEMLCYSVTVKHLVDALNNVGGRGLETIVEYYSFSNKPFKRGRSKSIPLVLLTQDGITEDTGINVLHNHEIFCDGFVVDLIADKRINMRAKTVKYDCKNRLIDYESLFNRHIFLLNRIKNRQFDFNKIAEELTVAIQHKDSLLFRHILAYCNILKSDIKILKQLLELSIENQCGCCAKAIAWQITRLFLKEVSVTECCDIWPGFRCTCKKSNTRHGGDSIYFCSPEVVIIVEVSAKANQCEPNSFYGIPIRYEKQICNSLEGKLITENITSLQDEDPELVTKVTGIDISRAKHYFAQHRKLSVISPSPIKSEGYPIKQIVIKEPCIQLYCRLKGYIPVGEAHFPYEIDGIQTDTLQGYAELLVEDIRIGSEVGRLGGKSGTLGGFVRYLGKDAFLTCAHVIIDKEYLVTKENRQKIHENTINVYYINQGSLPGTNALPCGELINFAFPPDESDGTTVDAAIIQLDKTCVKINSQNMVFDQNGISRSITDMGMSSEYLNKCCLDYKEVGTIFELQMRSSGSVSGLQQCQDKIVIEKERRQELQTFTDSVNEMVIRNPKPNDISEFIHFKEQVKTVADGELRSPRVFTVYNQLSFSKIAFQLGDSGTCIYAVGPNGITGCIGMAIASHPAGGCIVTPIKAILSSFRML